MTADFDPSAYTITIKRVTVDGERLFRATVAELPDAEEYGESHEEAYDLVIDTIESLYAIHQEQNLSFPEAQKDDGTYSGRVTLRMGTTLHRKAAMVAERERQSLNLFIVTTIAARVGAATAIAPSTHVTGSLPSIVQGVPVVTLDAISGYAAQALAQDVHLADTLLATMRHTEWAPLATAEASLIEMLTTAGAVTTERQPFARKLDVTPRKRHSGERRLVKDTR